MATATAKPKKRVYTTPNTTSRPDNPVLSPEEAQRYANEIARRRTVGEWIADTARSIWRGLCSFGRNVRDGAVGAARFTWNGICWTGRKGWSGLKATGRAGAWLGYQGARGLHLGISWIGTALVFTVSLLAFVLISAVSFVGVAVMVVVEAVVKLVQAIALLIATPYLHLTGQDVSARWKAYLRSWGVTRLDDLDTRATNLAVVHQLRPTQGKGRPTPRQTKRRPARPPQPAAAMV